MKIEIAESLVYSWLRHDKKCIITQTNWTPSTSWCDNDEKNDKENEANELYKKFILKFDCVRNKKTNGTIQKDQHLRKIFEEIKDNKLKNELLHFLDDKSKSSQSKSLATEIEKKIAELNDTGLKDSIIALLNNPLSSFLKQAEIDVIGMDIKKNFYAIDVAFHEGGLQYTNKDENGKNKKDNLNRVTQKLIRNILCFYKYFSTIQNNKKSKCYVYFMTPLITPSDKRKIDDNIRTINEILSEHFGEIGKKNPFEIQLLMGKEFKDEILNKVCKIEDKNIHHSELFLRAYNLYNCLNKNNKD